MAEILVKYDEAIECAENGVRYFAHAVASQGPDGLWQGSLEFHPVDGEGETLLSGRETTQPNRADVEYWAQGLTRVYLQGALTRAIRASERSPIETRSTPGGFSASANNPRSAPATRRSASSRPPILNPFNVYAQGEHILRSELSALSHGHVESIIDAYGFSPQLAPGDLAAQPQHELIEAIVEGVRAAAL